MFISEFHELLLQDILIAFYVAAVLFHNETILLSNNSKRHSLSIEQSLEVFIDIQ